jgi:hypothetical protein
VVATLPGDREPIFSDVPRFAEQNARRRPAETSSRGAALLALGGGEPIGARIVVSFVRSRNDFP